MGALQGLCKTPYIQGLHKATTLVKHPMYPLGERLKCAYVCMCMV